MRAIDATPDITLAELRERLITERGETFALSTIHDFYRRHRITFKKDGARQRASARGRSRTPRGLVRSPADLDPAKLVFLDETGATTKMARLRGRSLRGVRCRAAVPHGHWKTTTLVAGLRLDGLTSGNAARGGVVVGDRPPARHTLRRVCLPRATKPNAARPPISSGSAAGTGTGATSSV